VRSQTQAIDATPIGGDKGGMFPLAAFATLLACALAFLGIGASAALAEPTPTLTAATPTAVGVTAAHFSGTVNPNGGPSTQNWYLQYSTEPANPDSWGTAALGELTGAEAESTSPIEVSGTTEALLPNTTYSVRTAVYHEEFASLVLTEAPYPTFTTDPATAPTLALKPASALGFSSAHLAATIDPEGGNANPGGPIPLTWQLQISRDAVNEGWQLAGAGTIEGAQAESSTPIEIAADPTGLKTGAEYKYRLVVSYANLEATSTEGSFQTLLAGPAGVAIDPVTTHTDTTAHFSGEINPAGTDPAFNVSWEFKCNPECPGVPGGSIPAATTPTAVEADATGLEPNTTYEVKLIATNDAGPANAQTSFKTTAVGPSAETIPAFALGSGTEALLGGKVNPKNSTTKYWIEYGPGAGGPSPTYPSAVPATKDASAGSAGQIVYATQKVTGLAPASIYHFRVVAENATGTTPGEDLSFETNPLPTPPSTECPNAKLRTETNSAALPECRAYELVSPPDKNGGDANILATSSPDGNRVGFYSFVGFGDAHANSVINSYSSQRGFSGWATRSVEPPYGSTGRGGTEGGYVPSDFSTDASKAVTFNRSGPESGIQDVFWSSDDGTNRWVTEPTPAANHIFDKHYVGRSADASHVVFESPQVFTHEVVDGHQAVEGNPAVWEWVDGQVRLVSAGVGTGAPKVGTGINADSTSATNFSGTLPEPTDISADGGRIFLSLGTKTVAVREDGAVTRVLSQSQREGSVGEAPTVVEFLGAAVDGSRAYMTSPDQLTDDAPVGGGIYAYDLETDVLAFVGPGSRVLISADGRRAYFTSPDQLVPGEGALGARNLYTADDEGNGLAFVATLAPGDDVGPDSNDVVSADVKASPDGEHFVFQSSQRLTAFDNAGHKEIYLYDAGADSLSCASCRPGGGVADGDASLRAEGGRPRGLSDDGSVVFQTSDALVPADVNGQIDVYEYHDGGVALISTGTSKYDSEVGDVSPDGRDVFFLTRDSLVGQDIDEGSKDIYDARVEGGFPAPVGAEACEGAETCQGKPATPPAFASPATISPSGRGNQPGRKACKKKSKKQRARCGPKAKKHQAKKHTKKASKDRRDK
jgi:hypothetical protein